MGNDICSEAANYCNPKESTLTVYEYPTVKEIRGKEVSEAREVVLPLLEPEVRAVLEEKNDYLLEFKQKELLIRKKQFGDDTYEGEINNAGVPHGIGKMYKADGSIFVGRFVQGKAEGPGLYVLTDGAYFEGNLVNNQADCENGKYHNSQLTYEGGFKNNLFHGEGKEYSVKHTFVGTYENGLKKVGELKWWATPGEENRYCYYGKFDENGDFTEEGDLQEPTGRYIGSFSKGKKHGLGVYIFNKNLKYEGEYVNGLKEGKGKISFVDKGAIIYEGGFKAGLPQGQGYKYEQDGKKVQTLYKGGINVLSLMDPQSV